MLVGHFWTIWIQPFPPKRCHAGCIWRSRRDLTAEPSDARCRRMRPDEGAADQNDTQQSPPRFHSSYVICINTFSSAIGWDHNWNVHTSSNRTPYLISYLTTAITLYGVLAVGFLCSQLLHNTCNDWKEKQFIGSLWGFYDSFSSHNPSEPASK